MPGDSLQSVVQYLHRIIDVGPGAASDGELLERFSRNRDESAFALLVYRHGPMILGVCRRVLHHEHDSEDVFQATFLTLARRANSISKKDSLASWLYKVAFRIACRARGKTPMLTNQSAALQGQTDPDADVIWRDLRPVLDQEIAQLPASQSRPIILCYLEGKTHEEAAELLGWPKGTLAARLARGRERLRQRLTRRGWTLSATALATVLADKAGAAPISAELLRSTVHAALAYVSGTTVAVLSAKAVALAEGVLQMMWYSKVKMTVILLLAVALTGSGVGWTMHQALAGAGPEQAAQKSKAEPPGDPKADMAAMRAEIAKLRAELDAAMKKIKSLEDRNQLGDDGPLYKGNSARYWLHQLSDIDVGTRREAVLALAALAKRDKKLVAALIDATKDQDESVAERALLALGKHGEPLVPVLVAALKDAKLTSRRRLTAARALGALGPAAKSSVPDLAKALADFSVATTTDWEQPGTVIKALGSIGPDAKPALPDLARSFEQAMTKIENRPGSGKHPFISVGFEHSWPGMILDNMIRIDPSMTKLVPPETWNAIKDDWKGGVPFPIDAAWRQIRAELKKKYGQEKP